MRRVEEELNRGAACQASFLGPSSLQAGSASTHAPPAWTFRSGGERMDVVDIEAEARTDEVAKEDEHASSIISTLAPRRRRAEVASC